MKYVPIEQDIAAMLRRHGMTSFDPYRFTTNMTSELIELLHSTPERPVDVVVAGAMSPPGQVAAARLPRAPARSRLSLVVGAVLVLAAIAGVIAKWA